MKIGAQLYTVRMFCKTPEGIIETLEKLRTIGYRYIQFSGCGPIEPRLLRDTCDRLEQKIILTHSPFDRIVNDTDALIREHEIMGSDYISLSMMPKEYREDLSGVNAFIDILREPIQKITAAGMRFGYHNHALEFRKMEGRLVFDRLLDAYAPEQLSVVMDTYWVQQGGGDILQWIEKLAGRLHSVHFKDQGVMEDGKSPKMCPVGDGNLNFPAICKALEKAGTQYAFVEQDFCYEEDPFDCLARSLKYSESLGCEAR